MAEISFEEAVGAASKTSGSGEISFEEATGGFLPPKVAPQEEGFVANLKNPVQLWTEESLPANIYQAYKRGTFDKPWKELVKSGAVEAEKFSFKELVKAAKADPGRFGAELVNALVADPYLALVPVGLGGVVAGKMAVAGAKLGKVAGTVAGTAGKVSEAATVAAGMTAGIESGKMLKERGELSLGDAQAAAELGALLGGPFGLLARTRKAGVAPSVKPGEKPQASQVIEQATINPETGIQQHINDVLNIKPMRERNAELARRRKDTLAAMKENIGPYTRESGGTEMVPGGGPEALETQAFRVEERITAHENWLKQQAEKDVAQQAEQSYEIGSKAKQPLDTTSSEVLRIMQKPGFERTAEDLITLRKYERGAVDPDMMAWLGTAGIWGTAAMFAYEKALERAEKTGESTWEALKGVVLREPLNYNKKWEEYEKRMKEAPVEETPEGTFLAENAKNFAAIAPMLLAAGWVKAKGGMWHPEAVKRLAEAIQPHRPEGFAVRAGVASDLMQKSVSDWSDRAVTNYLNKHAGTATDPLKDIEIPFGDGTLRWEEVTDHLIGSRAATDKNVAAGFDKLDPRAKPEERVWQLDRFNPDNAITSYLSHVGDYLRQNVPPEKLANYDLVRAVKETAAKDAEMARLAEKELAASSKDLLVYKDYTKENPGSLPGMKWVELKLPEKLTEEQAKTIRPDADQPIDPDTGKRAGYVATDSSGKIIDNNYTGEPARGPTPEAAYLSGQLAKEGNQMGHCVGGYCEGVASGESRIFSLRDAKGKSHVTVEVEPKASEEALRKYEEVTPRDERRFHPPYTDNITQIKGKQNRAPNKEYLPYVQDFVRSGKWGEVGDLQNTGLVKSPEGKYLTLEEARASMSETQRQTFPGAFGGERGSVDPRLLAGVAAIGLGGLAGSQIMQDSGRGAVLGALASAALFLPGGKKRLQATLEKLDDLGGVISTRIGNYSPPIKYRLRQYEMAEKMRSYEEMEKAVPFLRGINAMPEAQRKVLERAMLTDAREATRQIDALNNPAFSKAWRDTLAMKDSLGAEAHGRGRFKTMLEGHFPRLVIDQEGLFKALGNEQEVRIKQILKDAEVESMKNRGRPLSAIEESSLINKEIQNFSRPPRGHQPGFYKRRTVEEITEELQPFYATPSEALYAYVRGTVQDLEAQKFFGKDAVTIKAKEGGNMIDVDTSIGNVVGRELREGKITDAQATEIIGLLQARFKGGEQVPSALIREVRNVINLGLLGNFASALTQLGDLATVLFTQDLRSTLTATAMKLSGRSKITMNDFGLTDHIVEELVAASSKGAKPSDLAMWVNKVFRYTITAVDRPIKDIALNASKMRFERMAQSERGVKQIAEKYQAAYAEDFPKLIEDLKAKRRTPETDALLFNELSDMQPISKSEVPAAYLRHPNWRLAYALKTFMLKQADVVRRTSYNEIKQGNVAKGLKNLTEYSLLLGLSGAGVSMVKDWLLGRPVDFDTGEVLENVLKTFGMGEYMREKVQEGKPLQAIFNSIVPPWQMMEQLITADPRAIRYLPYIGPILYSRYGGGAEKAELWERKKDIKAGKEPRELSPRAQEYLERERLKRRQQKEEREAAR